MLAYNLSKTHCFHVIVAKHKVATHFLRNRTLNAKISAKMFLKHEFWNLCSCGSNDEVTMRRHVRYDGGQIKP